MDTFNSLRIHPDLRFFRASRERGFLLGKGRSILLGGSSYLDVLAELAHGPGATLDLGPEKASACALLMARGYLVDSENPVSSFEDSPVPTHLQMVVSSRVAAAAEVESILGRAGIVNDGVAPVALIVADSYLSESVAREAKRLRDEGTPFILMGTCGDEIWLGPWFDGSAGPCYECLRQGLLHQRPVHAFIARQTGLVPDARDVTTDRASLALGMGWAALQLRAALGHSGTHELRQALDVLCMARGRATRHTVIRRPWCRVCGQEAPEAARPLATKPSLRSHVTRLGADTSARTVLVEDTLQRFRHHVSPICGVVTSLEVRSGPLAPELTTYGAEVPRTPRVDSPDRADFQLRSYGKGRTPQAAEASALCEALERASAVFHDGVRCVSATRAELGGDVIGPEQVQLFSERQRLGSEIVGGGGQRVPRRRNDDSPMRWTPVWSLVHDRQRYVPTSFCYIDPPWPESERACLFESNGHASGNCLEEAIVHGFLELVERDAAAIWWYNRVRRPAVDVHALGDPWLLGTWQRCADLGWTVDLLDLTHDLGVPVVAAVGRSGAGYHFGFGCDFELRRATERALTELAQTIAVSSPQWGPRGTIDLDHFKPDPGAKVLPSSPRLRRASLDLGDAIEACVAIAATAGLDLLVLDQTRSDIGLSAVKIVVPGLRTLRPRLAPGRLYEVPVSLGLSDRVLGEADLTPMWLIAAEPAPDDKQAV
jgi:bacteriocin biosynthesis cyclodehydratase domain-containing protein